MEGGNALKVHLAATLVVILSACHKDDLPVCRGENALQTPDRVKGGVIQEHSKAMVKEINLIGVRKVAAGDLKRAMFTQVGGYLSFIGGERSCREETFQRDRTILRAAYYDRGFLDVKIDEPLVSISGDKRFVYIRTEIEEGEAYRIGKIDFSGDLLVPKEGLEKLMTSRQGEPFNRSKISRDISAIADDYLDEGYAFAQVTPLTQLHR